MAYSTPGLLTDESRWLAKMARFQRMAIHAVSGGASTTNVPEQHELLSADTLTLAAFTYKTISFQVILGSVLLSMDGGSTFISYPVGENINMNVSGLIDTQFRFAMPGTALDGLNRVIVQTISA